MTKRLKSREKTSLKIGGLNISLAQIFRRRKKTSVRTHRVCGRQCAARALKALGSTRFDIHNQSTGAPLWPRGLTGSITHTEGYISAIVAKSEQNDFGIGIDAEQIGSIDDDMWPVIFTKREQDFLISIQTKKERMKAATILFSAKESAFKALPKRYQPRFLRHMDFEVTLRHRDIYVLYHKRRNAILSCWFDNTPLFVRTIVIAR